MKLYLARHGDYVVQNAQRIDALSEKGISDIKKISNFLQKTDVRVARVIHSGKVRAKQTAEILAKAILLESEVEEIRGISPTDDIDPCIDMIMSWYEDTLVVGHLPFMDRLVAQLICKHQERSVVNFVTGTIACLELSESGQWFIHWVLEPSLFVNNEAL